MRCHSPRRSEGSTQRSSSNLIGPMASTPSLRPSANTFVPFPRGGLWRAAATSAPLSSSSCGRRSQSSSTFRDTPKSRRAGPRWPGLPTPPTSRPGVPRTARRAAPAGARAGDRQHRSRDRRRLSWARRRCRTVAVSRDLHTAQRRPRNAPDHSFERLASVTGERAKQSEARSDTAGVRARSTHRRARF